MSQARSIKEEKVVPVLKKLNYKAKDSADTKLLRLISKGKEDSVLSILKKKKVLVLCCRI